MGKYIVGQKVYYIRDNGLGQNRKIVQANVIKVGRKYLYLDNDEKINILVGRLCNGKKVYLSREAIEEHIFKLDAHRTLRNFFNQYHNVLENVNIEDVQRMLDIIQKIK